MTTLASGFFLASGNHAFPRPIHGLVLAKARSPSLCTPTHMHMNCAPVFEETLAS